ncbi:helix-turn-helix transcriptional regulator [Paenibacillus sp. URB8-2]|uniref:helix-turn-helix transcriptional regulator n=1 Tax=Paenibacillus sp. URB8-2 TaxID=2741301 RepID=UPI0015BF2AB7|nr:AraC family transcriptional regulator [Paenibacillus sp. URB8-2]BCG60176.1 AraC family transcriptional regulator [Paenibacillus sp. URB8-2]
MKDRMIEDNHEFLELCLFTPSEYEKSGAAWPIRLGHNIAKPNYHIGPRTTPYYYLLFVLEGEGTFHQNKQTFELRKNDIFCLFPQVIHEYYTRPDDPLRKVFLAFDGRQALRLLEKIGLTMHSPHAAAILTPEAIQLMWDFFRLVNSDNDTDLGRLILFHRIFDQLSSAVDGSSRNDRRDVSWLQKGHEYMEIHYAEGITVERVSEYVGIDRTHFTKQYRKAYGITPIQFIQELKMKEARSLLEQTSYTLSEIAHSVGYPDIFSFSKAFKKRLGVAPTQYRDKKIQSEQQN